MALCTKKYKNGDSVRVAEIPSDNVSGLSISRSSQNFIAQAIMLGFMALICLVLFLLSVIKTDSGYWYVKESVLDLGDMGFVFLLSAVLFCIFILFAFKDSHALTVIISVDNRAVNAFGVYANAVVVLKTKKNSFK